MTDLLPPPEAGDFDGLVEAVERASWVSRVAFAVVGALIGTGCTVAAIALVEEAGNHWLPWILLILVVEPIAMIAFAMAITLLFPRSGLVRWFGFLVHRAKTAVYVSGILLGALVVWVGMMIWRELQ